jgi:hypothetical protein
MNTIQVLQELKEQLQENMITVFEGDVESEMLDLMCQIIVDTVNGKIKVVGQN